MQPKNQSLKRNALENGGKTILNNASGIDKYKSMKVNSTSNFNLNTKYSRIYQVP